MKMKKIFLLLAAITFIGSSCSDEDKNSLKVDTQLAINATELTFDKNGVVSGENAEVKVKCNAEWTLIGETNWCTPSVKGGKSDDVVSFQVNANESNESRSYTFAFVSGSKTIKMSIHQAAGGLLKPVQSEFFIGLSGGNVRIPIETNVEYEYEISANAKDWIKPSVSNPDTKQVSFLSFLRFDISAAPNNLNQAREGIITLKSAEAKDVEVVIKQERQPFSLQKDYYQVEPVGGTIAVQLDTELDYEIRIPDDCKDWISLASERSISPLQMQTKEFIIKPTEYLRSGKIIFHSTFKDYEVLIDQAGSKHKFVDIKNAALKTELLKQKYIVASGEFFEMSQKGVNATIMNLSNCSLTSLEGLEYFENLVNLDCSKNKLKTADFSFLKKLTQLNLTGNAWSEINLGSLNIRELTFASNYGLTEEGTYRGAVSKGCKIISERLETVTANTISAPYLDLAQCPALRRCNCNVTNAWYTSHFVKIILPLAVKDNPNFQSNIYSKTVVEYQ